MRSLIGKLIRITTGKRILLPNYLSKGTEASDLINSLVHLRQFRGLYLEVGVENGLTFESVRLRQRVGVDPQPRFRATFLTPWIKFHRLTSDAFFEKNTQFFDIIYLDGLHTAEQTLKDFHNAMKWLSKEGVIVIDDTIPSDMYSAVPNQQEAYRLRREFGNSTNTSWHGDVFKVVNVVSSFMGESLNLATIVSLDNPKTIVWRKTNDSRIDWEPRNFFEKLDQMDYETTFSHGIPSNFRPIKWNQFERLFDQNQINISE
jgi:hypothetical protein